MERRKFTREFKLAAVMKVVKLGMSCVEVARVLKVGTMCRLLEVSRAAFYKWSALEEAGPTVSEARRDRIVNEMRLIHSQGSFKQKRRPIRQERS